MQMYIRKNVGVFVLLSGMIMFFGCAGAHSELLYSEKFSGKYIAFLSSNELAVCSENPNGEREYSVLDLSSEEYMSIDETQKEDIEQEFIHLFFDEKYNLRSPWDADFIGLYNNDPEHFIPPEGPLVKYPRTFQLDKFGKPWNFQDYEKIYRKGKFFPQVLMYTPVRNSVFEVRDIESGNIVRTGNYPYGSYHEVFMNEGFDALAVETMKGDPISSPWEFYQKDKKGKWIKKRRFQSRATPASLFETRFVASKIFALVPDTIGRRTLVASKFGDRSELILYDFESDKFASVPVTGVAEVFRRNYTGVAYVSVSPCKNYVAYIARPRHSSRELRVYRIEWLDDLPESSLLRTDLPPSSLLNSNEFCIKLICVEK